MSLNSLNSGAGAKAGDSTTARTGSPDDPGHDRIGNAPGDQRDVDREGQQFAHLLRGQNEPANSHPDSSAAESSTGPCLESPFSLLSRGQGADDGPTSTSAPPTPGESLGEPSTQSDSPSFDSRPSPWDSAAQPYSQSAPETPGDFGPAEPPAAGAADGSDVAAASHATDASETDASSSPEAPTDDIPDSDSGPDAGAGDRILQGLFGSPLQSTDPFPLDSTATPAVNHDRIEQLADRLAERILVSDRTHTTDSEVRIQLRESVLPGTEITLRHDQGQLVVTFNVAQADTAGMLAPQTDDLQRALANKLNESVRIEVNVASQDSGGQGSSGDGRSRNRRDPRDEWGTDS